MTGGVSMGAFDFVPEVLEACGARFHIRKMAIKPGRPTIFATMPDGTLVFALPGNPAGAFVAFELLVKPALSALEGRMNVVPTLTRATLRGHLKPTTARRTYLPAHARVGDDGGWAVEALSWQGSGDSFGMATASALIMRPPNTGAASNGDTVSTLLLDRP
jgi:molybdopterin molybdotransferase